MEGQDFQVDYGCTGCDSAPNLELLIGNETWTVYSRTQTSTPGAIGTISIDATTLTDDFDLKILSPTGAGASTVNSIDLKDPDVNWTGHSSIVDGEISSHLRSTLLVVKDGGGDGGKVNFTVGGDVLGTLTIPLLESLTIDGDIRSGADIRIGNTPDIDPDAFLTVDGDCVGDITITRSDNLAAFVVKGDLSGAIVVEEILVGSKITVNGSISSTGLIDVNDMETFGTDIPLQYSKITLNTEDDATTTTAGTIDLPNGIPPDQNLHIFGDFTSTASIDLHDKAVYGYLVLERGGSGDILDGGKIDAAFCQTGPVPVCLVHLGVTTTDTYSGRAEFSAIFSQGILQISNLDGTIDIGGTMSGETVIGEVDAFGDVVEPGNIDRGGEISIGGILIGTLNVSGNHNGDILIGEGVVGVLEVGEKLGATGRILLDGACNGDILIGESTAALSLILATGGLGQFGTIVINDSEGEFNHGGTIHIGAPSTPSTPFVYDGCIRIKDDSTDGSHGDNNGRIAVIGCLSDDINICVDGDGTGTITLIQTLCIPNDWTHTCPSTPCGE